MIQAMRLKTEYLTNPTAVDEIRPRLGWSIGPDADDPAASYQTAYRILAATARERCNPDQADLWDSGWVQSASVSQIAYGGKPVAPCAECWWRVRLRDLNGREGAWSEPAVFRRGIERWQGRFIRYERPLDRENWELCPPVAFGRTVQIGHGVLRAALYITALGVYQVYVDGHELPDTILAPEWTNFWKRSQYRALDLTAMLNEGRHDLTVTLSNGWYSGMWQKWPPVPYNYGTYPELCAELHLEYADGRTEIIPTDGEWRATERLPVVFAGIYEGETIDARIPYPAVAEMRSGVIVRDCAPVEVCAQPNEPIGIFETIPAQKITSPEQGVYVADFGVNIAGRLRLKLRGRRGQKIEIFHNEVLTQDGRVYRDNLTAGHLAKPGVDRQMLRYTCSGEGVETCRPTFTYMGFRYAEITGLDGIGQIEEIAAEVFGSQIENTGCFSCSDPEINQLQENILRSARANFMGVPTDCPQRDERCGYTGDMQFFMPTALHNFDMAAFMKKWMVDLCQDSQMPDGSFTDHAPRFASYSNQVGWGDAGIICPYLAYREYGDVRLIRDHFDAMERYLDFYGRNSDENYTRGHECCGNGDWLHTGPGVTDELLTISYYCFDVSMMEEMARAIGREDRAAHYAALKARIKASYAKNFIEVDGSIRGAGVTGYALAFTMGLLPEDEGVRARAAEAFARAVEAGGDHITTGFIGTPRLLIALHSVGRDDLAQRLLMCRECPSWLYPVTVGATTIWERYDGWTAEKGFADPAMNSFNHFAFGSVGDYFYDAILGVRRADPATVEGYPAVKVEPQYLPALEHAEGRRRIAGSEIGVAWERAGDRVRLKVEVGANLIALVRFGDGVHVCRCGEHIFQ